jgi:hypothetical protein
VGGDSGRYYGLVHYLSTATPGGHRALEHVDHERQEVVYALHHGRRES